MGGNPHLPHNWGDQISRAQKVKNSKQQNTLRGKSESVERPCTNPPVFMRNDAGRLAFTLSRRLRHLVFERDHGVCAICGRDMHALRQAVKYVRAHLEANRPHWDFALWEFCRAIGVKTVGAYWEADHVLPRSDGGSDHIQNLQTLCMSCHHAETWRLVTSSEARKERRYRQFPQIRPKVNKQ